MEPSANVPAKGRRVTRPVGRPVTAPKPRSAAKSRVVQATMLPDELPVAPVEPDETEAQRAVAPVTFQRDPRAEALMREHFVKFRMATVKLTDIDTKRSHENQARIAVPINEETVLMYATAMVAGDQFPAVVVYRSTASKYIVLDGNHRIDSAKLADLSEFPAYIVESPTPNQISLLTYGLNTVNGMATSLADRTQQAISLIDRGASAVDAAAELRIPLDRVRNAVQRHEAIKRFDYLGIPGVGSLPTTTATRLASIKNDVALRLVTPLVIEAKATGEDVMLLVRAINGERTEQGQVRVIHQWRERQGLAARASAGGVIPVPKRVVTLQRGLTTVINLRARDLRADFANLPVEALASLVQLAHDNIAKSQEIIELLRADQSER